MRLEEYLQSARDNYVSFYREKLIELKSQHEDCVAELLVLPNSAKNPAPFSLLRFDAIYGGPSNPHPVRIALPSEVSSEFVEFEHSGVSISLSALSWENVSFSFESPDFQLIVLHDWLSKWIDDEEENVMDDLGLGGVVHQIMWRNSPPISWEIVIDLGSAPIACVLVLIELLGHHGVTNCILKSEEENCESSD